MKVSLRGVLLGFLLFSSACSLTSNFGDFGFKAEDPNADGGGTAGEDGGGPMMMGKAGSGGGRAGNGSTPESMPMLPLSRPLSG